MYVLCRNRERGSSVVDLDVDLLMCPIIASDYRVLCLRESSLLFKQSRRFAFDPSFDCCCVFEIYHVTCVSMIYLGMI